MSSKRALDNLNLLLQTKTITKREYNLQVKKLKTLQGITTRILNREPIKLEVNQLNKSKISVEEMLDLISKKASNGMWRLGFGGTIYTLNDKTRVRLKQIIKKNMILTDVSEKSDSDLIQAIREGKELTLEPFENKPKRVKRKYTKKNGAFFNYNNLTCIDLTRYAIYKDNDKTNYTDTCLLIALANGGLSKEKQEQLKLVVKNRNIPKVVLEKLCDVAQIQIKLKTDDTTNNCRNIYGKKYTEVYEIGLLEDHYFIIEKTNNTSFSIKNYEEVKCLYNYNHIIKRKGNSYERDAKRCIDSYDLIKLLLEHKDTLLKKISLEDNYIASTQFYDRVENEITNLKYDDEKCCLEIDKKETPKNNYSNLFFDFETNPNGRHKPYLCRTFDGFTHKEFIGEDCGLQMLFSLVEDTRLIAHNCTYDYRFIIQYLRGITELSRGTRLINASGKFANLNIEIKDSYHLISMPLRDFPKVFNLGDTTKEVMPYTLYTEENIKKVYVPIKEALELLPQEEHQQFLNNIDKWDLQADDSYDIIQYSSEYCKIDCEILCKGYNIFRQWIVDSFQLNIDTILTCASLAHQYFVNQDCYEDVYQVGGIPQMFIQGCLVGGRVMTSENKKIKIDTIVNDFDAVSLYPSAMSRMQGFLKGKPKVITNLSYDWIKQQDGYFVDIEVLSVGVNRKFPLMSYKNENDIRTFTNDMVGKVIRVDRTALEDLITFQSITFKVLRGYYFNEGFNKTINSVIKYIFNKRLEEKKNKNPVEIVYKLLMNSGYGKSIMKPIDTETRFFDDEEKFNIYFSRNYNWITSYIRFGNKIKVNTVKPLIEHYNIAQVGVSILSMSKRIMNEVMCLAEDNAIELYYQDTDSIHLNDCDISKLSSKFQEKYNRELIGKHLGQFHSDFNLEGCKDVVSVQSIFLGKKCYIDKLEGINQDGEKVNGFHIRMKGIPEKCIHYVVNNTPAYTDAFDLYQDLYNGNRVYFDLTNGGTKANFKFNKDYTIDTLSLFTRSICFNN